MEGGVFLRGLGIFIFMLLFFIFILSGCNTADLEASIEILESEKEEIVNTNTSLKDDNKQLKEKVAELEKEIYEYKNSDEYKYKLAIEAKNKGDFDEAIRLFHALIEQHPNSNLLEEAEKQIKEVEKLIADSKKKEEEEYIALVKRAKEQKTYDDAIQLLKDSLDQNKIPNYKDEINALINDYVALKNKPPLEILKLGVTFNSIDNPEARLVVKNTSNKTIDAYEVKILTFDNYNEPVNHYLYDNNIFGAISQDIIKPGQTFGYDYYWTLHGYENTTKIKAVLVSVHFTDDSTWENPNLTEQVNKLKKRYQ
jgi:tetratricopeptide (TPR) repeat protein